jgi:uncharacterized protein with PIN domain
MCGVDHPITLQRKVIAVAGVMSTAGCGFAMTGRFTYIEVVDFKIESIAMPPLIANPAVVGKVERLARVTGLSKTAAVERAVVLVDDLLRLPMFELVAPGKAELQAAFAAFVAYGRGSGHPAGLNYGDLPSAACRRWSFCPGKEPSAIAVWG